MDDVSPIAEAGPVDVEEHDHDHEPVAQGCTHPDVLAEAALPEGVVPEEGEERDQDHDDVGEREAADAGEDFASVVEDEQHEQDAGHPGPRGTPAEPVEGTWHELRHDLLPRIGVHRAGKGTVDEIEEIEMADPDDPGHDVNPPKERLESWHAGPPAARDAR